MSVEQPVYMEPCRSSGSLMGQCVFDSPCGSVCRIGAIHDEHKRLQDEEKTR